MSSTDSEMIAYLYEALGLIQNSDGTVAHRRPGFGRSVLQPHDDNPDPSNPLPVLTKDVIINPDKYNFARLFLPKHVFQQPESPAATPKLPLVFYFHGGGFVQDASPAYIPMHKFCSNLVEKSPCVLVSASYRLAPEHRLPASYDDCMEALQWVRATDDEWLTRHADFSNCFLMGSSSGANIAYHLGLRAAAAGVEMEPLSIRGLILHQPLFGGVERTSSEIRLKDDDSLPLVLADMIWSLALPDGADRDHEYCNPMKGGVGVEKMKEGGWRVLVTGYDGDPVVERQVELVKMMRERGVEVRESFSEGGAHGIELSDEDSAALLFDAVNNFINA